MAKKTITLMGTPIVNEDGSAGEAITPGHLVKGTTSILKQTATAGKLPARFALEREEMGKGIDVAYASGDVVKVGHFGPGERVYALIGVVTAAADGLAESAGDGTLRNVTTGVPIARYLEAVTNGAGTARIRVEIL